MKQTNPKIIPINKIDKKDNHALIPGYQNKKKVRKLKEFSRTKGNCIFTGQIPNTLIDFIYRSVIQLDLKENKLIFSRGAVKIKGEPVLTAAGIRELDWDVGVSIRIPNKLNKDKKVTLNIDDEDYEINMQKIVVLSALLRIAYPKKPSKWYTDKAVIVIAKGWKYL